MNKFWMVLLLFCISCGGGEEESADTIPDEIKELGSIIGNKFSPRVIINVQGGPLYELEDGQVDGILLPADPEFRQKYLVFNVHQQQTLFPENFSSDITFEQAQAADQASVDMLARVIQFFKQDGREVDVLGISFGAFMTQELISKYGIDIADEYLIMVGRLDINEEIWQSFSQGGGGGFTNGTETFTSDPANNSQERNLSRLAAGLGFKRYTEELAGVNDMSKITYVFGDQDEQVGALTDNERVFLVTRGARVINVPNANHDMAIDEIVNLFPQIF